MANIFNIIYVVAAVVLLFGTAIFVHEFGHFWVARRRGLKVEAFSIGFGPKIFGWTRDGIEYTLRWIPAGGYVKLPQMQTSDALEGSSEGQNIPPASPLDKILVAAAGPIMNLVFGFAIACLIWFVGLPMLVNPSIIGYVNPDSAEGKLGIREGDVIVEVDGRSAKSWQEVQMATVLARTNVIPVVIERDGKRSTYPLAAEPHPMLGKVLNLEPRDHPEVIEVLPGGAAETAQLKPRDVIMAFDGVPVASREQLIDLIKKSGGKTASMRIEREGQKLALSITPKEDPSTKVGRIGVSLGNRSGNVYVVQRPGPLPWAQIAEVWNQTVDTISALVHSKQTGVGAKDLAGPVGILTMLAVQVNTDYRLALKFLVLLNINLAILNLLPFPVLDGGHIMLSTVEAVRRRPLNARLIEYVQTSFAVLLISFMLYVTFFDFKRMSLFRAIFKQPAQIEQQEKTPAPTENAAPAAPATPPAPQPAQ